MVRPAAWQLGKAPLMTRWASEVKPANCLPEYPRPQMVRQDWLNLNGLWDYAMEPTTRGRPAVFGGQVLVPFPLGSALSGVMRQMEEGETLWYRRAITIPVAWSKKRVKLHCGAIDWQCRVFVNGRQCGEHRGGYDAFTFDITDCLRWEGTEEILIAVTDPVEGDQPRGKQSRKPEGCFYSEMSGVWQTIWLEPVPRVSIEELKLTPELDNRGLSVRVAANTLSESVRVQATAWAGDKEVANIQGDANTSLFMALSEIRPWSPDDPFLYDLEVTLLENDQPVDRVTSYFGMRKISLLSDERGTKHLALNNEPLFQVGVLDQGFWPDGIYTAPTDQALRSDLEFLKRAGFNLVRKHVKVEPERWYYWCDKMGLLVWQDMPSAKNATSEGRRAFETELLKMLRNLGNHPSIILWVLFNEGWGQFDTERLTQLMKATDPSRLVNSASGWTDMRVGDIVDVHSYPGPEAPDPEPRRAAVLGEFGGLGFPIESHSWPSNRWSYKDVVHPKALEEAYTRLMERVWSLRDQRGLSAAVYTQVTDVESESNGLLTYDRAIAKMPPEVVAKANRTPARVPLSRVVVGSALHGGAVWRYTLDPPAKEWYQPSFDVSVWKEGVSGFGTSGTPGARIGTVWDTSDIWLRREFVLVQDKSKHLRLLIHHDEDAEVYLNGVLAARLHGFVSGYEETDILPEALATLRPGENTLAVHCHQTVGGQYIDVGLVAPNSASTAATSQTNRQ
jgi:hypothetical protein